MARAESGTRSSSPTSWHSDSSFNAIPASYSLLSGRSVVSWGGNTEFADMRAAYDALDDRTKAEIEDRVCRHSNMYSRGKLGLAEFTDEERAVFKPVRQRLVRRHPVNGRKSLFLSAHAAEIEGMPIPQARMLLLDLTEFATREPFVYSHVWRVNDLVMWDNRSTMHRGRRFDPNEVRDIRQTRLAGEGPTIAQDELGGVRSCGPPPEIVVDPSGSRRDHRGEVLQRRLTAKYGCLAAKPRVRCLCPPGTTQHQSLIAGTWHRPLFLTRE